MPGMWRHRTLLREVSSLRELEHWRDGVVADLDRPSSDDTCPRAASGDGRTGGPGSTLCASFERFADWEPLLQAGFRRMQRAGELAPEASPADLTTSFLASLQGGCLLARTRRDPAYLRIALDMSLAHVREHIHDVAGQEVPAGIAEGTTRRPSAAPRSESPRMRSSVPNEPADPTALTCARCTHRLTRFRAGLLEDGEATAIREHLDSCSDCQLFADQMDVVVNLVGSVGTHRTPDTVPGLLETMSRDAADHPYDLSDIVRSLHRLADSLDPNAADDLVQQTVLAALEARPEALRLSTLAQELTDRALDDSGPTVRSLDSYETRAEWGHTEPDPDSESAEPFYPDFYDGGPDAGRHVNGPNRWGVKNLVSPEDFVLTADLFDVVDGAIARLNDPLSQLVQLVDIDDVPVTDAARALRLDQNDAVDALHRARVHLRGVVDRFISGRA